MNYATDKLTGFSSTMKYQHTEITWYERFRLLFIRPVYLVDPEEGLELKIKWWQGKEYILNIRWIESEGE